MNNGVFITEKAYRHMRQHIMARYPGEACGIMIGNREGDSIEDVYITDNTEPEENAGRSFFIDPLEIYRIEKETEGMGSIIGFFHSHPDKPAVPSKKDEMYMIPGMLYLIFSTEYERTADVKGYEKHQAGDSFLIKEVTLK